MKVYIILSKCVLDGRTGRWIWYGHNCENMPYNIELMIKYPTGNFGFYKNQLNKLPEKESKHYQEIYNQMIAEVCLDEL